MEPLLELQHVSKSFDGLQALQDISFQVFAGEILGVVGPNGAGKSTLFHLITGHLSPDRGSIVYGGRQVTHWPVEARVSAGISRTFQKTRLFYGLTVEANIRAGCFLNDHLGPFSVRPFQRQSRRQALERRVDRILTLAQLERFRRHQAWQLSYGYQRRLEVAIALGTGPKLLLLDEPFGGLSNQGMEGMGKLIRSLHDEGMTIMLIEHRMESIISYCNRMFVIQAGRIKIPFARRENCDAAH